MYSKNYFLVFVLTFFVAGFIFLALPDTSVGQDPGCCRTNGTSCFDEPGGTCMGNVTWCMTSIARCDTNQDNQYIGGQWCVKVPGTDPCEPQGCCLVNDECVQAPETGCTSQQGLDGTYLGDGLCGEPQFDADCREPVIGCCEDDPTQDQCLNGVNINDCTDPMNKFFLNGDCDIATGNCTPAPPIPGCCMTSSDTCNMLDNVACVDADPTNVPFNGGECTTTDSGSFCEAPPAGCCVCGIDDCTITTELTCENMAGECEYKGDNTVCSSFADECVAIVTNVPTIGQWGMIAMAGLLGIFSLFIIMRRHRYNVS